MNPMIPHPAPSAMPGNGKYRVVIDTDTYNEIDDQFAVVQALLSPDRLTVEALFAAPFCNERAATPGEGMQLSYEEILRLLARLHRSPDNLVYRGVTDYVTEKKIPRDAEAVQKLIQLARSASPAAPLYVIAIAAISNVASALLQAPDIRHNIVVIWLGGNALDWPDPWEFNLSQDIGGAQVLLESRVRLVLLPCKGVVTHLRATLPEIERYVEPHGEIGAFLASRFRQYHHDHCGWSKEIWDMAAVGWLLHPDAMLNQAIPAPWLDNQGAWHTAPDRHPVTYVRFVERNIILRDFFTRLAAWAAQQG